MDLVPASLWPKKTINRDKEKKTKVTEEKDGIPALN
jgi:hypothetical protein